MSKRVLIIGATGMAGHMVYYYLRETGKYELFNMVFRRKLTNDSIICDAWNKEELSKIIQKIRPDFVINCVGALIRESKSNPGNAIYLNACFPHILQKIIFQNGGRLIHISTDCVFSGKKGNYAVDDFRDADDVYGRSKALGEIRNDHDLTIRTSIIGPELKENGEGLLHWFLNQTGNVNGYSNVYWSGVSTLELSKIISALLENFSPGLIQISSTQKINKYDLLQLFKIVLKRNVEVVPFESKASDKSLIPHTPKIFHSEINYQHMIAEMYEYMIRYSEIYPSNYFSNH